MLIFRYILNCGQNSDSIDHEETKDKIGRGFEIAQVITFAPHVVFETESICNGIDKYPVCPVLQNEHKAVARTEV